MATNDLIKRLIDAGLSFTQMTQAKAEEIVKDMQDAGQLRVDDAQATVQELMARGRESTENLMRVVQREVTKQLESIGVDLSDLEARVEELAARVGLRSNAPAAKATAAAAPAKKAPAKKAAPKKATAKKAAPKKAATKKAGAKKTAPSKAAAKRSSTR